jgi:serine/threonine-protein kinase
VLSVGRIIDGRYRVDRHVGQGGFGEVYAGLHLALGVPIAIKVLRIAEGASQDRRAEAIERFMMEGRLLVRLRHPNIVSVLDLGILQEGEAPPAAYLVMEWVEGVTLRRHLDAGRRPLPVAEAMQVFDPLAAAVAHAHAANIVHRDLTPNNVMIVRDASGAPVPRVIDFGMAKEIAPETAARTSWSQSTTSSAFTPAYASPEQIANARTGPWTDVHALGLILVELLIGGTPYGRTDSPGLEAVDVVRPTPRARGIDVGPLEPVLAKALALRPAERFASAGEMLQAVRAAASMPLMARAPVPPPSPSMGNITGPPASRTIKPQSSNAAVIATVSIAGGLVLLAAAGLIVVPRFLAVDGALVPATDAAPPVTTTSAAPSAPPPPPTTTTSGKHAPPHPTPAPTPSPSPSPTPPAGRYLDFSAGPGNYGGLYPKDPDLLAVANTRSAALKSCFTATPVTDAWSVRVKVIFQKDGTRGYEVSSNHEGSPDPSPTAKSLESCHAAAIKAWPWPSSAGIDGLNGGPGYMIIVSSMMWKAH